VRGIAAFSGTVHWKCSGWCCFVVTDWGCLENRHFCTRDWKCLRPAFAGKSGMGGLDVQSQGVSNDRARVRATSADKAAAMIPEG